MTPAKGRTDFAVLRKRSRLAILASGLAASTVWTRVAAAQGTFLENAPATMQDIVSRLVSTDGINSDIVSFSIFGGAFSFAMMAATWLIRERRRLAKSHQSLVVTHADLRSRFDQAQALLDVPDQRVIVWSGWNEKPTSHGALPRASGAPEDDAAFVAFERWMQVQSVKPFQEAIGRLRERAEGFDLTIETVTGALIEAQGRASGSHAFVRFISLSGERAALASLENQHTELLQATDTMKSLLEALPMPVWLRDRSGKIDWVNPAYVEAVEADSIEQVSNENRPLLDTSGVTNSGNFQGYGPSLSHRELQNSMPDADERASTRTRATIAGDRKLVEVHEVAFETGSAGLVVDVSEIEAAQAHLKRTLQSHAQTMDRLATAVAIFDEDRHLIFHNKAFQTLWQLDEQTLTGEPDNATLFDELRDRGLLAEQPDWSKWRNGLLNVYRGTEPQEHMWQLPDGRSLRVVATPQKQGGVTWLFENITEQLEMESRYIALTQVQGETLDHLHEAIAVFASDGRLKLSNPSFQKVWRFSREQMVPDTPIASLAEHAQTYMDSHHVWSKLVAGVTGVSDQRETLSGRLTMAEGRVLDYALVPLPQGQSMVSFADVSASVRMEQALIERNEALEAAEQLKNAFIEHVSYEFRAPLTNIVGFADMLKQGICGPLNERQLDYVDHIESSSHVLHSMVDNMLDLATVDAGILRLDLDTVDLRKMVNGAVRSVSEQLREQNVRLNLLLPAKAESFIADATRVQQVLYNLLNNAIRFTPENSTIEVAAEASGDTITLRVTDSGPGVPEDQQETLFDRFAAHAHAGGSRGVGLGLAIARSLVELHGGTIALDTSVQRGASFVCEFPRRPDLSETKPSQPGGTGVDQDQVIDDAKAIA